MGGLIGNIVTEIESSREQMLKIIDTVSKIDAGKNTQKFLKEMNKNKKHTESQIGTATRSGNKLTAKESS